MIFYLYYDTRALAAVVKFWHRCWGQFVNYRVSLTKAMIGSQVHRDIVANQGRSTGTRLNYWAIFPKDII